MRSALVPAHGIKNEVSVGKSVWDHMIYKGRIFGAAD